MTAGSAADDILAEVFQELEKNENFELNFNELIPSIANSDDKQKSSKHKKNKRSKKKSNKKKKSQSRHDDESSLAVKKNSIEFKNSQLLSKSNEKTDGELKRKKRKRSHSTENRKKHSESTLSPHKRHKTKPSSSINDKFSSLEKHFVHSKLPENAKNANSTKEEKRKNIEEMYDEYERTINPNGAQYAVKAVPLEDYLKSKGYLVADDPTKSRGIADVNKKSDESCSDLPAKKLKSKENTAKSKTSRSTARSFIPRNLKLKTSTNVSSVEEETKSAPILVEDISEAEDNSQINLQEDFQISVVSDKRTIVFKDRVEISSIAAEERTERTECLVESDPVLTADDKIEKEETIPRVPLLVKETVPNVPLQVEDTTKIDDKQLDEPKIDAVEHKNVAVLTKSDESFEQLISKPIPKRIVIGILKETTKTLMATSSLDDASTEKITIEDGEIDCSVVSSISSPEIDVVGETDGEIKDADDETPSKTEKKKRKKHHKSDKHKAKRKKIKSSSSSKTNDSRKSVKNKDSLEITKEFPSRYRRSISPSNFSFNEDGHRRKNSTERSKSLWLHDRRSISPRSSTRNRSRPSFSHDYRSNFSRHWERRNDSDYRRSTFNRSSSYDKQRRTNRSTREEDERLEIDKKELYDIARRNASAMLQQGTLQQIYNLSAQEIAKLKAGGKSVDELVDYCRKLQKKEDRLNHNSDSSSDDSLRDSNEDPDVVFRHPFALNPPKNNILFNVRNMTQIPIKSPAERAADETKLKITFPVSSGQQHRTKDKEDEWVPVTPALTSAPDQSHPQKKIKNMTQPLAIEPPPDILLLPPPPQPPPFDESDRVFAETSNEPAIDIGEVVASRLTAIRRIYDNPNDVEALKMMHFAEENMKKWAESKNVPGGFLGGTGAVCLTPNQLAPRDPKMQAWARKDQLISCKPVESGVGMSLLQKMGWKPGEGLGKNKGGSLIPLLLDVKSDRKGLVANEELTGGKIRPGASICKDLQGRHPVSVLMELCAKRRWNPPSFSCVENGPSHSRRFLWKVVVNGVEYQPAVPSNNKKIGKAQACQVVLQSLGMVPRDQALPMVIG